MSLVSLTHFYFVVNRNEVKSVENQIQRKCEQIETLEEKIEKYVSH